MTFEDRGLRSLDYAPCRYGTSKLMFRGPSKTLDGDYIAFLGGTETYGKFVQTPFPEHIENLLGMKCINLGCMQAGPDAYLHDSKVTDICNSAQAVVLQVPHASNLSNRLFSLHPRRNDRFLRASTMMQAIYHDVDFTDFTFVRHMLMSLREISSERFEVVIEEMQKAWIARMRQLLEMIQTPTLLFGLKSHHMAEINNDALLGPEPLYVNDRMILDVEALCVETTWITPSPDAVKSSQNGMIYPVSDAKVCDEVMGPLAHKEVAKILSEKLNGTLKKKKARK